MIDDTIEEHRTLSKLTERFHIATSNGKTYGVFAGIALPLDLAYTVALWTMTGAKIYQALLEKNGRLEEISRLNPADEIISQVQPPSTTHVSGYLFGQMAKIMKTWDADHFEDLLLAKD